MSRFFNWIKQNKIVTIIIVVLLFVAFNRNTNYPPVMPFAATSVDVYDSGVRSGNMGYAAPMMGADMMKVSNSPGVSTMAVPSTTASMNRMVIQESYLSLLVKNVEETQKQILQKVQEMRGVMVNSNINNPQEAATATLIVRVPANQLTQALDTFKGMAIKVTSENLQGEDVTDQYTDIQAQMTTLLTTKEKFEDILAKAATVSQILEVQRELINLQLQIDSLKGQEQYYKKNAEMAKLTVYLSTDELSLPYQPSESWRPQLVFKQAVQSLIRAFRSVGSLLIWLAVFSVIWLPILGIIYFLKKRRSSNTASM